MKELLNYLESLEENGYEDVVLIGIPQILTIEQVREILGQYDKEEICDAKDEDDNLDFTFYGNKARIELF